jgi:tRNA (cytidine/uridine-2'-O-)-methyltransferase
MTDYRLQPPVRPLHIVLFQPEIPQNTGNIIRLCFLNHLKLHLIEPLGFTLEDTSLRRAGIDYWDRFQSEVEIHKDWEIFAARHPAVETAGQFFSAHTTRSFWEAGKNEGLGGPADPVYLVFGRETAGLPEELHARYRDRLVTIPKRNAEGRSLNLSNAVAVAAYEFMRRDEIPEKSPE